MKEVVKAVCVKQLVKICVVVSLLTGCSTKVEENEIILNETVEKHEVDEVKQEDQTSEVTNDSKEEIIDVTHEVIEKEDVVEKQEVIETETIEEIIVEEEIQIESNAPIIESEEIVEEETRDVQETTQESPTYSVYYDNYAYEVLSLVNEYRVQNGLNSLEWDSNLASASNIRAVEIQSSFSHTRPNESECFSSIHNIQDYWTLGENIAYGYYTPNAVMDGWMNSQGHRENILNPDFTKLGVSCYLDSNGTFQWVQLFGA